ncbi:LAMI_0B01882g1_1 [Lachancea mirantina]|uniref:LAMI_0B01882g1_1 n=1 Tax=Lachancea mirantina TaxID=1230905 RepID=A0A1G4ITW8_9SACH|nr:LAMI_0B01882g1_1 [Lachancea mirantina]
MLVRCGRANHLIALHSRAFSIKGIARLKQAVVRHPQVEKLTIKWEEIQQTAVKNERISTKVPIAAEIAPDQGLVGSQKRREKALPPSLRYVREIMDKYEGHVVLTQMGSFYELYFEHAEKYAPKLNLTLTSRDYALGRVSFAGFPVHQLGRHLRVLVRDHGYSVAVADQFKKDLVANNETQRFSRRVTRIVTPGTFIDEAFENLEENTYLLSIDFPENCMRNLADINLKVGLCWCDVSTGEIFAQQVHLKDLVSAITRVEPQEILLDESIMEFSIESGDWYPELVSFKKYFLKYQKLPSHYRTLESFSGLFNASFASYSQQNADIIFQDFTQKERGALKRILAYLEDHMPDTAINLQIPKRQSTNSVMQIDSRTSSALELHFTVRTNSKKGSLLSVIRRTVTPSGTRLLTQWLAGPTMDLAEIKLRHDLVSLFKKRSEISSSLIDILKQTFDMPKILQKFSFGKGDAMELVQLSHSLQKSQEIKELLIAMGGYSKRGSIFSNLIEMLSFDESLVSDVLSSLDEEKLAEFYFSSGQESESSTDEVTDKADLGVNYVPWVVRHNSSELLARLHHQYQVLCDERKELLSDYTLFLVDKYQIRNAELKLKQTNEFAIYVSGTPTNLRKLIEGVKNELSFRGYNFHIIQKSSQTCWLSHESWTSIGQKLEYTNSKIKEEESRVLEALKSNFIKKSAEIRSVAQALDYLDVLTSFSKLAKEKNLVRPEVSGTSTLHVVGGRHLVVEEALGAKSLSRFTENDCRLSSGDLWMVTGPNMGGKSTFLRQNAIIVILAQIGCFVPCKKAHVGLVDKIFSRVGSADDLYNEMSTFMVEMVETSYILRGATEKSLAILDEVGRGTSGKEGVSIAFATLKYLMESNRCRSLFATHFGSEIINIMQGSEGEGIREKISCLKTEIVESGNNIFHYDHQLKPGVCTSSDALKIAKVAGFPRDALEVATRILA